MPAGYIAISTSSANNIYTKRLRELCERYSWGAYLSLGGFGVGINSRGSRAVPNQ
jgi:hypothetical protein